MNSTRPSQVARELVTWLRILHAPAEIAGPWPPWPTRWTCPWCGMANLFGRPR